MKQIIDSMKNGALQGAQIGGLISAVTFSSLAIMSYSGVIKNGYTRGSKADQILSTFVWLIVFAPIVMVATGTLLGVYKSARTGINARTREHELESALPLPNLNQSINHRDARRKELSCLN